jgi:protocatechuate 3,4-dioxygenase beta subunit
MKTFWKFFLRVCLKNGNSLATVLLPVRLVGALLTARFGQRDAGLNCSRPKPLAAAQFRFFRQTLVLAWVLSFQFNLCAATDEVGKFSGTVVDAQGTPVAGATVVYYQYSERLLMGALELETNQQAVTDGQGAFEFSTFQGQGIVVVTKAGMAPAWRDMYSTQPETQKIVLGASASLAGKVVDDAGQPVAEAEVWVVAALNKTGNNFGQPNLVFGKIARGLFSVRTSAEGTFRIENFPADAQASLVVKKTGMAMHPNANPARYDELPFQAGQKDIRLTLNPAGSVTGKVVARETGKPLASAMVRLQPLVQGWANLSFDQVPTFSAVDGSFQIANVSAGSYRLKADFTNEPIADWVADTVPVTVTSGQTVPDVQIQAYKGGVAEVTVRGNKYHELLANVNVNVNSQDDSHQSSTGTNGVASFRLPPGQFNIFATKSDRSPAQKPATVTEGETTRITIELDEPIKVTGIVRDTTGVPVAGASVGVVTAYWNGGADFKTDANGHYELNWQKPAWAGMQNQSFYLLARHEDRRLAAIQEINEAITNLDVILKPAINLSGQVQDASGKAITNVTAYVSLQQENSSFTITRQPIFSDGQGRIKAEALPRGERYGWYVSAQGYGGGHQEMEAADPEADHYDFPPFVLQLANRKLAGRVLGVDGKPVPGVQVWMNGEGQPNGNATTDADGQFVFDAVCAGPVQVSANGNGYSGVAEAMGGDTKVVIRFEARNNYAMQAAPLTLTGNVLDPAGNHAVGALVMVTPSWGAINTTKTDDKGDYSVNWQSQTGMRGAKYFVIARDVGRNLAAIEAIETNSTHVSLRLEPGFSISGTVQDLKGAPLVRANVNLNLMAGNMGGMVEYEPVKLDSEGAFTIPALPMGQQYGVYVSAKGYGSTRKTVRETQSQTNSLQLSPFKLRTADRPLAGKVLNTDNKPAPGVQVNINGEGQPNGNMRTDEDGNFKFTVCDGPIQIFAWSQSGSGGNNSGSVQARGGDIDVTLKLGVRQRQPPTFAKEIPLKPQSWTVSALVAWPASHKTGAIILLSLQAAVLLGTGGGIFWFTRKRG